MGCDVEILDIGFHELYLESTLGNSARLMEWIMEIDLDANCQQVLGRVSTEVVR